MDIDLTLVLQLGLFLLTLTLLNRILLRPLLSLFEARHDKVYELKIEAEKLRREAKADAAVYEGRLRAARDTGQHERELHIRAAREEERQSLVVVREEVAKTIGAARQHIAKAEQGAAESLEEQAQRLSLALVAKVLGRETAS